jgi:LmbE family N-acetylglucosaminyl deacetylase
MDPIGSVDREGRPQLADFYVNIGEHFEVKKAMLAEHASQREWLMKHHGMDQYLQAMSDWGSERGRSVGVPFAEGFRQHLGHSYPRSNLLLEMLGGRDFTQTPP